MHTQSGELWWWIRNCCTQAINLPTGDTRDSTVRRVEVVSWSPAVVSSGARTYWLKPSHASRINRRVKLDIYSIAVSVYRYGCRINILCLNFVLVFVIFSNKMCFTKCKIYTCLLYEIRMCLCFRVFEHDTESAKWNCVLEQRRNYSHGAFSSCV